MKHALAVALRRMARALIRQSNKLVSPAEFDATTSGRIAAQEFAAELRREKSRRMEAGKPR